MRAQDPDARPDEEEEGAAPSEPVVAMSPEDAATHSRQAFERVLELGARIEYDHWLLYYSRASSVLGAARHPAHVSPYADYELGRLLACTGDKAGARKHLDTVASGRHLESSSSARKGKYSMEVRPRPTSARYIADAAGTTERAAGQDARRARGARLQGPPLKRVPGLLSYLHPYLLSDVLKSVATRSVLSMSRPPPTTYLVSRTSGPPVSIPGSVTLHSHTLSQTLILLSALLS